MGMSHGQANFEKKSKSGNEFVASARRGLHCKHCLSSTNQTSYSPPLPSRAWKQISFDENHKRKKKPQEESKKTLDKCLYHDNV